MSSNVKVRFAPSPTGYLHIGGARTALFNWLFARHNKGVFLLRIEDTDQQRSTEEATQAILDSMKWLGLDWDEGPYFQSQRLPVYKQHAEKLVEQGKAFYDTDAEGRKAIRFTMQDGVTEINDLIHGTITFDTSLIEDFVILKADGFPTYNFACVVDDAEMGITHIIRGDDHISNTPKQIALYKAFGFKMPEFAHIPMILGEDGSRLSKRHGATSVTEYRDKGYLPHALVNFLALLGWSPGNDQEIISIPEMIEKFTLKRANKTSAQFNNVKLDWMNGQYIKNTPVEQLIPEVKEFFEKSGVDMTKIAERWLFNLVELHHERFRTFQDLLNQTRFFFADTIEYDQTAVGKFLKKEGVGELLKEVHSAISQVDNFDKKNLEDSLRALTEKLGIGFSKLAQPMRVAITGRSVSAGIFETMELLGKEKTIKRLNYAIKNQCETPEAMRF
ncbi:MAG: glutamate--tRNA ligase [Candidatus Brocadia sp. AMX2]|uniref:Glutamate--tRNA ligase n=1 Tax=Candidatus Brocadia sinica JPN1 TaxID=1197129 RepID=A0ABQ0JUS7_9BACT|nr:MULTISPECIES: glutamate--tRNA ligase [Brocadia]KXK31782.1 MAG: glutamyl-tRNA synthetase [Candidatus Brocadia sinica]MBC6933320.1 glutamate--tRNA ligase [Candidatus Brocadia sp.]MBL1169706.1 glutamate--tRNA ligase [Candidatus Brocadia sp. AMX1]NOG41650.1 glutamate--tRNA ligase [Planctomycetota bacterium]KAA0244471.1 MAG: glutamate--tRNA ligase [Candidatus Brocadia sp. AMX2]